VNASELNPYEREIDEEIKQEERIEDEGDKLEEDLIKNNLRKKLAAAKSGTVRDSAGIVPKKGSNLKSELDKGSFLADLTHELQNTPKGETGYKRHRSAHFGNSADEERDNFLKALPNIDQKMIHKLSQSQTTQS